MRAPLPTASSSPPLADLIERRQVLKGGLAVLASGFFGPWARAAQPASAGLLGFRGVPASSEDRVIVPEGYTATPLALWGDPVGIPNVAPAFQPDASNTAAHQATQFGMNFDGMEFFSLPHHEANNSDHGLIAVNHEYIDRGLLHPNEPSFGFTAAQIEKELHAVGVSVFEVKKRNGLWVVVKNSKFAQRVTAVSRIRVSGPAAEHALLQTEFCPKGDSVFGTLANCSAGRTPWGTYLTCEENFQESFMNRGPIPDSQKRYTITEQGLYGWAKASPEGAIFERFDAHRHPNEVHRFGWIVEVDPYQPEESPVKHTALGRFKHENAAVTIAEDDRVVVYMGDDEADEYLYKFVSTDKYQKDPAKRAENKLLLTQGTLYVASFQADGTGKWVELSKQHPTLRESSDFPDQGTIVTHARLAADATLEATKLDRPEWIALDPLSDRVYCTLTNNSNRAESGVACPRSKNQHGHIVWWRETSGRGGQTFEWDVFVLAGDPDSSIPTNQGNNESDLFSCPDGLAFDARGVLWIQTDISNSKVYHPVHSADRMEFAAFRNNQMLAVDRSEGAKNHPVRDRIRRFLTGPVGCEVTGFTMTPDLRSLFVNIQHPGEPLDAKAMFNDPRTPTRYSSWPHGGRPRSGTVVISKNDGGVIGT